MVCVFSFLVSNAIPGDEETLFLSTSEMEFRWLFLYIDDQAFAHEAAPKCLVQMMLKSII